MAAGKSDPSSGVTLSKELEAENCQTLKIHLESVSGKKPFDLVIDSTLMRPLDRLVHGVSFFKNNGAQRIFKLEETMRGDIQRIYIIRPTVENIRLIVGHVTATLAKQRNSPDALPIKTIVLFVPRKSFVCDKILEEEGVYGHVIMDDLKLDFLPFDEDLISMELPQFFRDVFLDGDLFWLSSAASGLTHLKKLFGHIPNVIYLGSAACDLKKIHESHPSVDSSYNSKPAIHTTIVMDRNLDLVTPMMTQITYEGMLDETYGISCGMIEFPEEVTKKKSATKLLLTNDDPVYKQVRNRHFTNVFGHLKAEAKKLQARFESRHDITTVGDMKEFVGKELKRLKEVHKALEVHIGACENIIQKATGPDGEIEDRLRAEHTLVDSAMDAEVLSYIEDHLALQTNELKSLRLMCLASAVSDGLSEKHYATLKAQFLQAHGFDHLPLFHSLKKVGLFRPHAPAETEPGAAADRPASLLYGASLKGAAAMTPFFGGAKSSAFFRLSAKLKLVPKDRESIDLKDPTSMSYIFSGAYAPLSCGLVEDLVTKGYEACKEYLGILTPHHDAKCDAVSARTGAKSSTTTSAASGVPLGSVPGQGATVLVLFLGGVTFAEIAALRFLGKVRGVKFVVASTAVINGDSLIESIADAV